MCISDTHNQTPKLPPGDVLIHAGDLTNQGSYSELKKTVEWLERADFEAKIVVAGNHDITLDESFYHEHGNSWRWPQPQDPALCRMLLTESKSITYLENEATTVRLASPKGPGTCFTVFGSPCTPKHWNWAFQYEPQHAESVWGKIPSGVDVVVTHTPPQNHCDGAAEDERSGCPVLLTRLGAVRPMLNICGHIHAGRGVERVRWRTTPGHDESLEEAVEHWTDPGIGNKKLSLLDLTSKSGRALGSVKPQTRQRRPDSLEEEYGSLPDAFQRLNDRAGQPASGDQNLIPTSSLTKVALYEDKALWGKEPGSAVRAPSDIGRDEAAIDCKGPERSLPMAVEQRSETVVINAALLGPRVAGRAIGVNKPIVVDVELPVWQSFHGE